MSGIETRHSISIRYLEDVLLPKRIRRKAFQQLEVMPSTRQGRWGWNSLANSGTCDERERERLADQDAGLVDHCAKTITRSNLRMTGKRNSGRDADREGKIQKPLFERTHD